MVESRQLESTQFSSYDKATLLTACPRSSTISLQWKRPPRVESLGLKQIIRQRVKVTDDQQQYDDSLESKGDQTLSASVEP